MQCPANRKGTPTMASPMSVDHPELFAFPIVLDPSAMPSKELSLYLAVMHHGLATLSNHGTPASKETVTRTAEFFRHYLLDETR